MKHGLLSLFIAVAALRCPEEALLRAAASQMRVALRSDIAKPKLRLETQTSLVDFQDAMQAQWKDRPPVFTNAYSVERNEIFLIEDAGYYQRLKRLPDDSLVHEFVHFLQVRYKGARLDENPDEWEHEAIHVQSWAREALFARADGSCPWD